LVTLDARSDMNLLSLFENSNFPLQCGSVGLVHTTCEVMKGGRAMMLAHDAAVRRVIFEVDVGAVNLPQHNSCQASPALLTAVCESNGTSPTVRKYRYVRET
jgi:hypothetical protein